MRKFVLVFTALCMVLVDGGVAYAHPSDDTVMTLSVQENGSIVAESHIPVEDLNAAINRAQDDQTITDEVKKYVSDRFSILSDDKQWQGSLVDATLKDNDVVAQFRFVPPDLEKHSAITVDYRIVLDNVNDHSVLIYVNEVDGDSYPAGTLTYDYFNQSLSVLMIELDLPEPKSGFFESMMLGIEHFRQGFDHILFLITLLLVAPFVVSEKRWQRNSGWRKTVLQVVLLSAAFTVGHSLSLFAGSFLDTSPVSGLIEVLIAATILLSAFHALRPIFGKWDVLIVPVFGLVHGLAFSSELFKTAISWQEKLVTTFAFNVGLELFQLLILVLVVPVYLFVLKYDHAGKSRIGVSIIALICAGFWFVTRLVQILA